MSCAVTLAPRAHEIWSVYRPMRGMKYFGRIYLTQFEIYDGPSFHLRCFEVGRCYVISIRAKGFEPSRVWWHPSTPKAEAFTFFATPGCGWGERPESNRRF